MAESVPESSSPGPSPPPGSAAELDDLISRVSDLTDDVAHQVGAGQDRTVSARAESAVALTPPPAKGKVIQLGKGRPHPTEPGTVAAESPTPAPVVPKAEPRTAPTAHEPATASPVAPPGKAWVRWLGGVLDICDRPFRWCGPSVRAAAGWAALALSFGAALVFLMSFFP